MAVVVLSSCALVIAVLALIRAYRDHSSLQSKLGSLQHRVLEAQRSLRQRGDLANELAHEIKNPLTAILCSAETLDLILRDKVDSDQRQTLKYIKEYGDNLLRLVSDFLDLNRAETGNLRSVPEQVEVWGVVESILGLLQSNAHQKQIELKALCTEKDICAYVDPSHLKQVLFNLVHNAIKFTPTGGEVQVLVRTDFPSPFLTISVKDNGVGIPPEQLESIFDVYARYEQVGEVSEPGVGLGLALCKALVELSGGSIEVESSPGVGSVFSFRVPLSRAKAESDEPTILRVLNESLDNRSGPLPLAGQSFLVVDEDSGSRIAIAKLIEAWGGMVDQVCAAAEAVEALEQRDYDAIMIDDDTDENYGLDLARYIRDDEETGGATIIITAKDRSAQEFFDSSIADLLVQKPLNGAALLRTLVGSGKYQVTH